MYGGTFNYPQRVTQLKFHTYEQKKWKHTGPAGT